MWLRRVALAAAAFVLILLSAVVVAFFHLDWIAKWSIHRVFPGIRAEMTSLRVEFPSRLLVRDLELFSASDGELLLRMQGGVASFQLGELPRARIEAVELEHPSLVVSPRLSEALGIKPAEDVGTGGRNPFEWSIGRLDIRDGRLRITKFGERSPTVEMVVTATLENLGIGGDLGTLPHAVEISKIIATTPSGEEVLEIERIGAHFTTEGLFTRNHVESVSVGDGRATITRELLAVFGDSNGSSGAQSASPSWTVGSLDLERLSVEIPDAPGTTGRVAFRLAATLRDIGAPGSPAGETEQSVTLSALRVESARPSAPPLLEADSIVAAFSVAGLSQRTLREVRLTNPSLTFDLSPTSDAQSATPTASSASDTVPMEWLIERFVCSYGTLAVLGIRDDVTAGAKFAIDAQNLGTLGEAATTVQKLTVWDGHLTDGDSETPVLTLDVARMSFTPDGVLQHRRIDSLDIEGGRLRVGADLQALFAAQDESEPATATGPDEDHWSIGTLRIAGIRTRIEDDRPGLTELRFTVNTELQNVSTAGLSGRLLDEEQTVEFADIILRSPLDREVKILALRSVFVHFTLRKLSRKNLQKVVILRPSIFLNRDLFVYMERATAADETATESESNGDEPQWSVDELEVKFGKLVLGSGGEADVGLPIEFETTAQNIALDNLAALEVQAVLTVPKQSYDFADYQLEIDDVEGDLRFAYPPEKGEKNLVQKLDIASVRWRQFEAEDAWIAATFDARGINGQFGGMSYEGYVNGGFSFFFAQDSPWIGWVAGTGVNTVSLTDVISPQNFRMTGPLDFSVQIDAFRKDIDRVRGDIRVTEPGRLQIGKLDDLIARIPDTWTTVKQDITRIGLETLRDFDYTEATGEFWFVQSQGILNLDLSGPHGSRNFEIVLHDGQETDNPWQQGRLRAQSSPSPR